MSTYGFQKLSAEYFCKGAYEQYGLPSKGQDPLHILGSGKQIRCYTNGKDIARGVRVALEAGKAHNEDFNISTSTATSVLELAKMVWKKMRPNEKFSFVSDQAYEYDVQKRIPDVSKANKLLGFTAGITLEESVDEVIEWFKKREENG